MRISTYRAFLLHLMLALLACGCALGAENSAQKRVALVIGNSNYQSVPHLANTLNDAGDIADALKRLGFDVKLLTDLTVERMLFALKDFSRSSENSDVAVVYYGGHGIEIAGTNYLVPVDASLERQSDVPFEAIPLEMLTGAIAKAKGLRLIILDACRENPFKNIASENSGIRIAGRGGGARSDSGDSLIVFAAKEGEVALDGDGRNSPFVSALLKHIDEPGLELGLMFRKVRDDVLQATARRQEPYTYGSLSSTPFYFVPAIAISSSPVISRDEDEWNAVKNSKSAYQIGRYIAEHQGGRFVSAASNILAEITVTEQKPSAVLQPAPSISISSGSASLYPDPFSEKHDEPAIKLESESGRLPARASPDDFAALPIDPSPNTTAQKIFEEQMIVGILKKRSCLEKNAPDEWSGAAKDALTRLASVLKMSMLIEKSRSEIIEYLNKNANLKCEDQRRKMAPVMPNRAIQPSPRHPKATERTTFHARPPRSPVNFHEIPAAPEVKTMKPATPNTATPHTFIPP